MLGSPSVPTITSVWDFASGTPASSSTFCRDKCPLKAAWSRTTACHGEKWPLAPLKGNPQTLHPQGQLWGLNSTWEVLRTDLIKCSGVVAASSSTNFTNWAPCSQSHVKFWLPRGLWDALLQSETKPSLQPLWWLHWRQGLPLPSEILLGYHQQKAARLCHMVRISSNLWKWDF